MRAVSLRQPWASLVSGGAMGQFTTIWRPRPTSPVGQRIGIHASRRLEVSLPPGVEETLKSRFGVRWNSEIPRSAMLSTGVVRDVMLLDLFNRATGELVGRRESDGSPIVMEADTLGEYDPENDRVLVVWLLEDVEPLPVPVYMPGGVRLWTPPSWWAGP